MPAINKERELKLLASGEFEMPPLVDPATGVATVTEEEPSDLTATYFDTKDLRLFDHGITLRYRSGEENGPVWTVKLPVNGDPSLRSEIEFKGDNAHPPAEARDLLFGVLAGSPLNPVAEIKTRRSRWRLLAETGDELAELVDDRVSILEGNRIRDTFREIEIEARTIDSSGLKKLAGVIEKAGARPEQRAKVSRALEALREKLPETALPPVSPRDPADAAVRPAIDATLRQLLQRDPYARLHEPAGVHKMRVAVRRMRSVFRTFAPLIGPSRVEPVVEDLRWLGRSLGAVRDLDVLQENLRAEAAGEPALDPLFEVLAQRNTIARATLSDDLSSKRYLKFLHQVNDLVSDSSVTIPSTGKCSTVLPGLVGGAWRKLRKAARKLDQDSPEQDLHRTRILAKRARYAAETIAEFTKSADRPRLRSFAAEMTTIQNVLGEHQDATVAHDLLFEVARERSDNSALSLHLGRLIERSERKAKQRRKQFLKTWDSIDKGKIVKWPKLKSPVLFTPPEASSGDPPPEASTETPSKSPSSTGPDTTTGASPKES